MQKLERLGLAEALSPAQWRLSENAEPVMRALGEQSESYAGNWVTRLIRRRGEPAF